MRLEELSGLEIGKLVNSGELSPVEVVEYFAKRIEEKNPNLNAFTYTKIEDAIQEAKKLESKIILEDQYCGRFAGVPIGLKDFLDSKKGWTNSHGGVRSLVREDQFDSVFYEAANRAGAIAVGKTNAPPFGFSGTCNNEMYGSTKNPFNTEYSSGGSSGGTACAVASGLITFGEGGDAGGSIRIPAAWCNCFGFKPSAGYIPNYCRPDGWAATHPFCCNGSITKTVDDSAIMFVLMSRYDPKDPYSVPYSPKHFIAPRIRDMRVAVTYDFDLFPAPHPDIQFEIDHAAKLLRSEGADVDYVKFNFRHGLDELAQMWCKTISIDTSLDLRDWKASGLDLVKDHREELPEEFIYWNEQASTMDVSEYRRFNEMRTDILDQYESVFEKYDILLSPVSACLPAKVDTSETMLGHNLGKEMSVNSVIGYAETFLANFIGYPAASVPMGFSKDEHLPIGVQVTARRYRDTSVLAVSKRFEELNPWRTNYIF